jgi:hypothetical protein
MSSYERLGDMFTDAADTVKAAIESAGEKISTTIADTTGTSPSTFTANDLLEKLVSGNLTGKIDDVSYYAKLSGLINKVVAGVDGQTSAGASNDHQYDLAQASADRIDNRKWIKANDLEYSITSMATYRGAFFTRFTAFTNYFAEVSYRDKEAYFNGFIGEIDPLKYLQRLAYFPAAGISLKPGYIEHPQSTFDPIIDGLIQYDNVTYWINPEHDRNSIKEGEGFFTIAPKGCVDTGIPLSYTGYSQEIAELYTAAAMLFERCFESYLYRTWIAPYMGANKLVDQSLLQNLLSQGYAETQRWGMELSKAYPMEVNFKREFYNSDFSIGIDCKISDIDFPIKFRNTLMPLATALGAMMTRSLKLLYGRLVLMSAQDVKLGTAAHVLTLDEQIWITDPQNNPFLMYDDVATKADPDGQVHFIEASQNQIDDFKARYKSASNQAGDVIVNTPDAPYLNKALANLTQYKKVPTAGGGALSISDKNFLLKNDSGSKLGLIIAAVAAGALIYAQNK